MSNTDPDDKEELHLVVEKLTIKEGGEEEISQVDSKEERKEIVVKTETLKTTKVAFSSVEIKVYPYILGDNPSVPKGSPLTIDWEPMAVQVYDSVDAYETARGGEGYAPRDHFNLLMPMVTFAKLTTHRPNVAWHARPSIFPRAIENNPSPRMTSNQNRIINLKSRCARSAMSHGGEAPNKKNDT